MESNLIKGLAYCRHRTEENYFAATLRLMRLMLADELMDVSDDEKQIREALLRYYCRPPPHTMCPTAFLAPTLTAKTCFICTQPQNAFFLAQLALQGNRANGKKSLPGRVPGPKKGTKMVPNSGSLRRILLAQWPKKVPKIGPGPALA